MIRAEFSPRARADLLDILSYGTAKFGLEAAEAYVRRIDRAIALICDHPQAGMIHDDVRPPVRSIAGGQHRVFYDELGMRIVILRVLHKAMDIQRHL